jgi:hypothetical protein
VASYLHFFTPEALEIIKKIVSKSGITGELTEESLVAYFKTDKYNVLPVAMEDAVYAAGYAYAIDADKEYFKYKICIELGVDKQETVGNIIRCHIPWERLKDLLGKQPIGPDIQYFVMDRYNGKLRIEPPDGLRLPNQDYKYFNKYKLMASNEFLKNMAQHPVTESDELSEPDESDIEPTVDPDDWLRFNSLSRDNVAYSDDKIVVYSTSESDNSAELFGGKEFNNQAQYGDVYIALNKANNVPILAFNYDKDVPGFRDLDSNVTGNTIPGIFHTEFAESIKRAFIYIAKRQLNSEANGEGSSEACGHIVTVYKYGGLAELDDALSGKNKKTFTGYNTFVGLAYGQSGDYKKAAYWLGRKEEDMTADGCKTHIDNWDYFSGIFTDSDAADRTLTGETDVLNIDDNFIENTQPGNLLLYLTPKAKAYIYDNLMNNRRILTHGDNGESEWIVCNKDFLKDFGEDDVLSWIDNQSEEEVEAGTYKDITDAVKQGAYYAIENKTNEEAVSKYVKIIKKNLNIVEHAWSNENPSLIIQQRWVGLMQLWKDFNSENSDAPFINSLDELLQTVLRGRYENPDTDVEWPDFDKDEYARETLSEPVLELEPLHEYVDPKQTGFNFKVESILSDIGSRSDLIL